MNKFSSRLATAAAVASLLAAVGTAHAQSTWLDNTMGAPHGSGTEEGSLADRMERGTGTGIPAYPFYDASTHNRVAMSEEEYRRATAAVAPAEPAYVSTPAPTTTADNWSSTTVAANDSANNAPMGSGTEEGSTADRMERTTDTTVQSDTAPMDNRDTRVRRARADRN